MSKKQFKFDIWILSLISPTLSLGNVQTQAEQSSSRGFDLAPIIFPGKMFKLKLKKVPQEVP